MTAGFRTKVFIAAFVRPRCRCWRWRPDDLAGAPGERAAIERHLRTRPTSSRTCSPATTLDESNLDREADRLGEIVAGRVTLIAG